tara:strand:+ start:6146 stop:6991 length:846 start_codon:yes stop_codon:yes gene_type:complete
MVTLTESNDGRKQAQTRGAKLDEHADRSLSAALIADFLTIADLSEVFEHAQVADHIEVVSEDDGETHTLPGEVAAQVIDFDDLAESFLDYCDALAADADFETQVRLTAVAETIGADDLRAIGNLKEASSERADISRMLEATLRRGVLTRASEGAVDANAAQVQERKKANRSKLTAEGQDPGESGDAPDLPQFGLGISDVAGLRFAAALIEDAEVKVNESAPAGSVRIVNRAGSVRTGPAIVESILGSKKPEKRQLDESTANRPISAGASLARSMRLARGSR